MLEGRVRGNLESPGPNTTILVSCPLTMATFLTADQPVPRDHSLRATDTAEEFLPREGSCEGTQCQGASPEVPFCPPSQVSIFHRRCILLRTLSLTRANVFP